MTAATETRPLFIRLTLPDGLEEALEGLAREVLRNQPENILEFAANHFEQLVKTRGPTAGMNENLSDLRDKTCISLGKNIAAPEEDVGAEDEDEDRVEIENIEGESEKVCDGVDIVISRESPVPARDSCTGAGEGT